MDKACGGRLSCSPREAWCVLFLLSLKTWLQEHPGETPQMWGELSRPWPHWDFGTFLYEFENAETGRDRFFVQ